MIKPTIWHGCYDGNQATQKEILTKESLAHPAKMSIRLTERIFEHGQAQKYWKPGDLIIDPFGGIGTTGIIGAYRGYPVFAVELEQNFVDLGAGNIDKNRDKLQRLGLPVPRLVQGDSRRLVEIIGSGQGAVSSPPFLQSSGGVNIPKGMEKTDPGLVNRHSAGNKSSNAYGDTAGQVHNLPEGDHAQVVGALSSPPYADTRITENRQFQSAKEPDRPKANNINEAGYSHVAGSISSPPYSDARIGETSGAAQVGHGKNYGQADGQLGSMPEGDVNQVIAGITSPPYEDSLKGIDKNGIDMEHKSMHSYGPNSQTLGGTSYGQSPGQVGAESGDSYWQSVSTIYQQVYQLLPPSGIFAVVVKDFVRDWQRIPLCDQTAELLEAIGFTVIERIHAMLVKEIPQTINMFTGEAAPKLVERKSFFRRLLENKGSPRIDYEEVIFVRKTSNDK